MQPYVIRQGDFLDQLAHQFGFDVDTVWNDPANGKLTAIRKDPNILAPTDVLYIPDDAGSTSPVHKLSTGQTNTFVADPPKVTISVRFADTDASSYASKAFTVAELADITGLTTDGDGVASFQAPVTMTTATLTFTESGETWTLCIGSLDPVDTISGIFQRLQNLGYIPLSAQVNGDDLTLLRRGLSYFTSQQTQPPPAPPDDGDSGRDDDSGQSGDAGGNADTADDGDTESGDDSANLSFADDLCSDDCGLSDQGTLEPELQSSLLQRHGG
ncbi:MAG: hypothetical protein ABSF69_19380 [Polyangiaceae bacterium]|jgi:hypothetical protein